MPTPLKFILILLCLANQQPTLAATLNISIPTDVHNHYQQLIDGKPPLTINDYRRGRRSSTETLLLIQMLKAGHFKGDIKLQPFSRENYARTKLRNTNSNMLGASEWLHQITLQPNLEQLLISSPIVRKGEYKVGIYTRPGHPGLTTPDNLSGLSATTHRLWLQDTSTLNQLQIDSIHFNNSYDLMLKMVNSGRVDLMLSSFKNTKDMELTQGRVTLTPLKGVQVAMNDSRHWYFFDRNNETSRLAYTALEKGIKDFRKQGRINRAFTECGFFSRRTNHWHTLGSSD